MEDDCWDPPLSGNFVGLTQYAILLLQGEKLSANQLMVLAKIFDFGGQNLLQLRKSIYGNTHVLATGLFPAQLATVATILQREGILHEIVHAEDADASPLAERLRSDFVY